MNAALDETLADTACDTIFSSEYEEEVNETISQMPLQIDLLNNYLGVCGVNPVQEMKPTWDTSSDRTKRRHLQQARESVLAILQTLAPHSVGELWKALVSSGLQDENLEGSEHSSADSTFIQALVECYLNASDWSARRQILSIMADKLRYNELKKFLPEVTLYRFKIARQHLILHGRGVPVPVQQQVRMAVDPKQLDHFITFITSPNVIQDVPFGEKIMQLRTGEILHTPNVIRNMIPSTIIKQYIAYCEETSFPHLSESSLRRILDVCPASTRRSLQGLDYFTANGTFFYFT